MLGLALTPDPLAPPRLVRTPLAPLPMPGLAPKLAPLA
jgi:hypothetical protein